MKEKWKKLPVSAIVFMAISALLGIGLVLLGLLYKEPYPAHPDDDALFMNMLFTVPGLVWIADSLFCLQYDDYRKKGKYVLHNSLLFFFVCLIAECVYFQLIYFGVGEPQYKMVVPALIISFLYTLLTLLFSAIYLGVRKRASKHPRT